jgi:hypothetical protein
MTVTANNPALYNAAFAGALAGQLAAAGITGIPTPDDSAPPNTVYAAAANNASEFAYQFDQVAFTGAVTNLSASNATVPPATAAEAATTNAFVSALFGLAFAAFFQRQGAQFNPNAVPTGTQFAALAAAVAAQFAVVQYELGAAHGSGTLV